ncbi:MAG: UDP-N-acetylglucosamine diphosphorylase [Pseudomonadota bacterium]
MEVNSLCLSQVFPETKDYLPRALLQLFQDRASDYSWKILGSSLKEAIAQAVSEVPRGDRLQGQIHPGAWLIGDQIVIEAGAMVEAGAYIEGPTFIAKGAVVRHGAYIRGHVYVGPNSIMGHTTEAKESLLLADAKAAHFAYLGNSLLGNQVNLGAGTKLANLRLDHQNIKVRFGEDIMDTGLKKFGAILGDHAQTGCNSVTNPGTVLLPGSAILPCTVATGIVSNRRGLVKKK